MAVFRHGTEPQLFIADGIAGKYQAIQCLGKGEAGRRGNSSPLGVWAWKKGAKTRDSTAISLMRMFRDGPEVSFSGSPTVSPMTAALCASEPLPPRERACSVAWACIHIVTRPRQHVGASQDAGKLAERVAAMEVAKDSSIIHCKIRMRIA